MRAYHLLPPPQCPPSPLTALAYVHRLCTQCLHQYFILPVIPIHRDLITSVIPISRFFSFKRTANATFYGISHLGCYNVVEKRVQFCKNDSFFLASFRPNVSFHGCVLFVYETVWKIILPIVNGVVSLVSVTGILRPAIYISCYTHAYSCMHIAAIYRNCYTHALLCWEMWGHLI